MSWRSPASAEYASAIWPTEERTRELRAMPYHEYLQTTEWNTKRRVLISTAQHKCERCGTRGEKRGAYALEVHHKTYVHVGDEQPGELEVLCRSCHQADHDAA